MTSEIYKIGKNILENLTSGMYTDSKFIYREYVQNAADAIDSAISQGIISKEDAKILINISSSDRTVCIEDNATGITQNEIGASLGNIADSDKDASINKGFRGIGRLGGLAYCKKLIFETSAINEPIKTVMIWNAELLHNILNNSLDKSDAASVIDKIVQINTEKAETSEHYFKVTLQDIKQSNNDLLDKKLITEYLSQVAPVDFNTNAFLLGRKIKEEMQNHGHNLDTYKVYINNDQLYKVYQTSLLDTDDRKYDEIRDIDYKEFYNSKGELLAWGWVGISKFDKCIPEKNNLQRGIRLKKANIQLGGAETLNKLHKEPRGNGYFVGEIHAVHSDLKPNARRDYFNETSTLKDLEAKLKAYFIELYNLYHLANDQKNAIKKQQEYVQRKQEYEEKQKTGDFINPEDQKKSLKQLEELKYKAEKAKKDSDRISKKAEGDERLKRTVTLIKEKYGNDITDISKIKEKNIENKKIFRANKLNKLNREERKLIGKIYEILEKVLDPETKACVINKIEEEFS